MAAAFNHNGEGVGKDRNEETIVGRMIDKAATGAGDLMEQARQVYLKYGPELAEEANDAVNGAVKNAARDAVRSFFQSIIYANPE